MFELAIFQADLMVDFFDNIVIELPLTGTLIRTKSITLNVTYITMPQTTFSIDMLKVLLECSALRSSFRDTCGFAISKHKLAEFWNTASGKIPF